MHTLFVCLVLHHDNTYGHIGMDTDFRQHKLMVPLRDQASAP